MPWNDDFETMPVEKLQKFQLEKLRETVAWVAERVPFYRNKFEEMGITAESITGLEDAAKLPMTQKNDLRDNYPFGLCAVPLKEVVRVHASSGTTGKPITGPYTAEDLDQWIECMARNLWAAGIRKKISFKMHTVTVCSPAAWVFIRGRPASAALSSQPAPV